MRCHLQSKLLNYARLLLYLTAFHTTMGIEVLAHEMKGGKRR